MEKLKFSLLFSTAILLLFCQSVQANCPFPKSINYNPVINAYQAQDSNGNLWTGTFDGTTTEPRPDKFIGAVGHSPDHLLTIDNVTCLYKFNDSPSNTALGLKSSQIFNIIISNSKWRASILNLYVCYGENGIGIDVHDCPFVVS